MLNARRGVLTVLCIAANYWALPPSAVAQHLTDEWVKKAAEPLIKKQLVDGLSIGYLEGEHYGSVHLGSSGKDGKPANNMTLYEIGSISKVFTSLLLADAVARGEITLDAPAEVKNAAGIRLPARDGRAIQWLDLSTHRSALPRLPTNLQPADPKDPYRDYDATQAAAFLNTYELPRKPGEKQEYSNLGAAVLGYLIAQQAGKTYSQLLSERIAEPLRMADCTVELNEEQTARFATPHSDFEVVTAPWVFADMPGAGGIRATMRDMMRFAKAQLSSPDGKLGEAIELAWKQHSGTDASGPATGLGWMIAGDGQTRWHNGRTGGFASAMFINRPLKSAVIVLCNTSVAGEADLLATRLIQKAAGQDVEAAPRAADDPVPDKPGIDAKHRRRLVGRYQLAPDFIFTVRDKDGHLMVGITNQPTQEVFPDSPTRWSYRGVDATLEFQLPKTGPAQSLILHQNGIQQTARRMK